MHVNGFSWKNHQRSQNGSSLSFFSTFQHVALWKMGGGGVARLVEGTVDVLLLMFSPSQNSINLNIDRVYQKKLSLPLTTYLLTIISLLLNGVVQKMNGLNWTYFINQTLTEANFLKIIQSCKSYGPNFEKKVPIEDMDVGCVWLSCLSRPHSRRNEKIEGFSFF